MTAYHLHATLLPDGDAPSDLWVRDGRFTFEPIAGAEELVAGPAFALPGLVDCHAHTSIDVGGGSFERNLRAHLASGTLALRDPGSPDGAPVAWQGREGFPRLQAAARFLAPEGRYNPGGQWTAPADLAEAATAHVRAGASWVKLIADWGRYDKAAGKVTYPANYDAASLTRAVAGVHAAGGRVVVHCQGPEGAANVIAAGVDSLEHGDGLTLELLETMAVKGIAWTPTLAMTERLAAVTERTEEARRRFANERYDAARFLLPAAARLGVTILAGTDLLPPGSIADEVESLTRHGLGPRGALAAASTAARAYLGIPRIAEGAPADLVVYAADPRETVEILRRPSLVMLGGRRVSRAD